MRDCSERTTSGAPCLERDKVVAAALTLLDEVGFEGLTVRRLATKLGVKASALYWHFENKQDLIDQLASAIISDESLHIHGRDLSGFSWQELLQGMGHGMRNALMRYRDGALIIAKADLTKNRNFEGRQLMIDALAKRGFSEQFALGAMFTVGRFTLGCVFEEQADPRGTQIAGFDPEQYYAAGLGIIIAGVEQQLLAKNRKNN